MTVSSGFTDENKIVFRESKVRNCCPICTEKYALHIQVCCQRTCQVFYLHNQLCVLYYLQKLVCRNKNG